MVKRIALFIFTALTITAGLIFKHRLTLPYNEMGRYFDEDASVVYDKDAILFYGFITLVLFIITIVIGYRAVRKA